VSLIRIMTFQKSSSWTNDFFPGWTTEATGFDSQQGQEIFPFVRHVETGSGAQVNFHTMRTGRPSWGVKQPVRAADTTSHKLTTTGAILHSPIRLQGAVLS
jgi:hypothetical protein